MSLNDQEEGVEDERARVKELASEFLDNKYGPLADKNEVLTVVKQVGDRLEQSQEQKDADTRFLVVQEGVSKQLTFSTEDGGVTTVVIVQEVSRHGKVEQHLEVKRVFPPAPVGERSTPVIQPGMTLLNLKSNGTDVRVFTDFSTPDAFAEMASKRGLDLDNIKRGRYELPLRFVVATTQLREHHMKELKLAMDVINKGKTEVSLGSVWDRMSTDGQSE